MLQQFLTGLHPIVVLAAAAALCAGAMAAAYLPAPRLALEDGPDAEPWGALLGGKKAKWLIIGGLLLTLAAILIILAFVARAQLLDEIEALKATHARQIEQIQADFEVERAEQQADYDALLATQTERSDQRVEDLQGQLARMEEVCQSRIAEAESALAILWLATKVQPMQRAVDNVKDNLESDLGDMQRNVLQICPTLPPQFIDLDFSALDDLDWSVFNPQ